MKIPFRKQASAASIVDRVKDLTRYSEIKRMVYRISSLQKQKTFRSLAILSAYPGEGRTLVCAALAISYAENAQSKVLVLDTTTRQNPESLMLRDCLEGSPLIDFISLSERRGRADTVEMSAVNQDRDVIAQSVLSETEIVPGQAVVSAPAESDQVLIHRMTHEYDGQYGLILLDTAPLTAQNKSNIDPLLVAHVSDASLLVVSPKLLNSSDLQACLKTIGDPTLNLIGMISNEDYSS